jgi:hypothetical protein
LAETGEGLPVLNSSSLSSRGDREVSTPPKTQGAAGSTGNLPIDSLGRAPGDLTKGTESAYYTAANEGVFANGEVFDAGHGDQSTRVSEGTHDSERCAVRAPC